MRHRVRPWRMRGCSENSDGAGCVTPFLHQNGRRRSRFSCAWARPAAHVRLSRNSCSRRYPGSATWILTLTSTWTSTRTQTIRFGLFCCMWLVYVSSVLFFPGSSFRTTSRSRSRSRTEHDGVLRQRLANCAVGPGIGIWSSASIRVRLSGPQSIRAQKTRPLSSGWLIAKSYVLIAENYWRIHRPG